MPKLYVDADDLDMLIGGQPPKKKSRLVRTYSTDSTMESDVVQDGRNRRLVLPLIGTVSTSRGSSGVKVCTYHTTDMYINSVGVSTAGSDCPIWGWMVPFVTGDHSPTMVLDNVDIEVDLPEYLVIDGVAKVTLTIPNLVLASDIDVELTDIGEDGIRKIALTRENLDKKPKAKSKAKGKAAAPKVKEAPAVPVPSLVLCSNRVLVLFF